MYAELALGGGNAIWRSSGDQSAIIPADGCVDLILRDEEVFVAGPSTSWIQTRADDDGGTFGFRIAPGGAASSLALDLVEIRDRVASLSCIMGRDEAQRVRNVLERARVTWSDTPELAAAYSAASHRDRSWVSFVRRQASRGIPPWQVAEMLDCSPRTFRRRMLTDFGYPYLTLVRINRATRAQALLREGTSPVEAAARAGYADQSHLSREFGRLVGASPGQFLLSSA